MSDDEDMPPPDVAPSAPTHAAAAATTNASASADAAPTAAAAAPVPAASTPAATSPSPSSSPSSAAKAPSLSRAETCPAPMQNNASDDEAEAEADEESAKRGLETVDEEDSAAGGGGGGGSAGKGQPPKPSSAVAQAIAASAALRAASAAARPSAASVSDSPSALHNLTKRSSVWVSLLQRSYNPPFLSPSASILHHSGLLKKFGSKLTPSSLNARFFHLVHHSLQYYKSNPFSEPQGSIPLAGAVLTTEPEAATLGLKPLPQPNCCFSVTPRGSNRTYLFVTDDPNQRTVWLELLSFSTVDAKRTALQPQSAGRWNEDANLLVEGWVTKRGGDAKALSWKKRYCVYQRATHTLVYLKSAPARAAGFVPIEKGVIVDMPGSAGSAKVPGGNPELQKHSDRTLASLPPSVDSSSTLACTQSDERCYVMLAASKAERDEWVQALRGAVAYCDGVTPSWEPAKNRQARISTSAAKAAAAAAATPASATPANAAAATPAPSAAAASSSAASPSSSSSASNSNRSKSESMAMDCNPLLAAAAVGAGAGAVVAVAATSNTSSGGGGSASPSSSPAITPKDAPSSSSGPSSAASTPAATPVSTPQTKPAASPASPQASPAPSPQKVLSPSARQQSTPAPAAAAAVSTPNNDDDWDAATLTGVRTKGQSVSYINVQAAGVKPAPGPSSVAGSGAPRLVRQPSRAKVVTTGSEVTVTASSAPAPAAAGAAATTTAGATTPAAAASGTVSATGPAAAAADAPPAAGTAAPADPAPAPVVPAVPKSTGNVVLVEKSISELYSTEATYVGVLSTICNSYILRLRKHLELGLEPRWFDDAAELAQFHIFQHAVSIRDINARLLKELEAIASSSSSSSSVNTSVSNAAAAATAAATTAANAVPGATPSAAAVPPITPTAASAASGASSVPELSRMQHLSRIGSTFRQFIPFFKVYSSYAKSYDDVRAFEALAERRPSLKTFLSLTDACECTTLSTLMITPVQRVGRYVMLLDTILKNVPRIDGVSSVDGLADVELALDEMKKVATLINETVALWEATSKVVELQAKIDASILQPGRYLVREGVLKKTYKREPGSGFFSSLAKKEAPFVFFLLNDALLQAKKATLGEKYNLRATMPLHGMCLEDVPDSDSIKHAWSIYYGSGNSDGGGGGAGAGASNMPSTPSSKQGGGSDADLGSPGGVRHSRTESADTSDSGAAPTLSLGGGGGAGAGAGAAGDKKAVLLYAKTAEEKAQWMSDINALIEANNRKKTSLIAGLARQGTQAQL